MENMVLDGWAVGREDSRGVTLGILLTTALSSSPARGVGGFRRVKRMAMPNKKVLWQVEGIREGGKTQSGFLMPLLVFRHGEFFEARF